MAFQEPQQGCASDPGVCAAPPQISDYSLLCRIGRGSYGEVWMARNVVGTYRAVKIVYRRSFVTERPFEREFRGIQKFEPISRSHESQVDILHIGRNEDCFYYVMELADDASGEAGAATTGGNAGPPALGIHSDKLIASYKPRTLKSEMECRGRLPVDECLEIGLALTTALAHLHKHGLVHRDVKPSNVIYVEGVPKLADIGLVTDADGTVSFVGTEGFIPPEGPGSAQGDIYSLGKVLYELSTGKDRQDYPEPPTHLGEFEDRDKFLELRQVIQKACARDLTERYQSAESMQADLLLLKTGKSVRRTHQLEARLRIMTRVGLAAAAVMLLGVVPYLLTIREARSERRAAAKSQQVTRVLEKMFSGIQPLVAQGRDTRLLLDMLDQFDNQLASDLKDQPEVEAQLRMLLATSYQQTGHTTNALAMAREALRLRQTLFGPRDLSLADTWTLIGVLLYDQSDFKGAEAAALQALQIRRGKLGPGDTNVALSLNNAGLAVLCQGRFDEAEKLHRASLTIRKKALGSDNLEVAKSLNNLAMVAIMKGDPASAEEHYGEALRIFEKKLPQNHPFIAVILNNIANLNQRKGELELADRLHTRVVEMRKKIPGPVHSEVAGSITQLGRVRAARGDLESAEKLFRESIGMEKQLALGDHMLVADSLSGLAGVLARKGDLRQAEDYLSEAFRIRQIVFGVASSDAADCLNSQGIVAAARGDIAAAKRLFLDALVMTREAVGSRHQDLIPALWLLSWAMRHEGQTLVAENLEVDINRLVEEHGAYGLSALTGTMYELADTLRARGFYEPAEQVFQEALLRTASRRPGFKTLERESFHQIARFYEQWHEAEPEHDHLQQALEWRAKLALSSWAGDQTAGKASYIRVRNDSDTVRPAQGGAAGP